MTAERGQPLPCMACQRACLRRAKNGTHKNNWVAHKDGRRATEGDSRRIGIWIEAVVSGKAWRSPGHGAGVGRVRSRGGRCSGQASERVRSVLGGGARRLKETGLRQHSQWARWKGQEQRATGEGFKHNGAGSLLLGGAVRREAAGRRAAGRTVSKRYLAREVQRTGAKGGAGRPAGVDGGRGGVDGRSRAGVAL